MSQVVIIVLEAMKVTLKELRPELTEEYQEIETAAKKAKQYGKGYTGFLSRLLDEAIKNEEMVRKCI